RHDRTCTSVMGCSPMADWRSLWSWCESYGRLACYLNCPSQWLRLPFLQSTQRQHEAETSGKTPLACCAMDGATWPILIPRCGAVVITGGAPLYPRRKFLQHSLSMAALAALGPLLPRLSFAADGLTTRAIPS